mmetsp:Transcript_106955/g.307620  ORF Transcript_106955/g.307620 Transcript_106955/m.307620 type:complete len:253 (+) Transcript_106955:133-891(+)
MSLAGAGDLLDCSHGSDFDDDPEFNSSYLWPQHLSLDKLPPLPKPSSRYRSEPFMGICIVVGLSALLVSVTQGVATQAFAAARAAKSSAVPDTVDNEGVRLLHMAVNLIWAEAITAVVSMLYLLLGSAGVIRRSARTCYPVPGEVAERVREGRSMEGLKNLRGPMGSRSYGSYCVRCLVWRPPRDAGKSHHCNVCQRCVKGFDHHCGVFGRCIVRGNMPCFFAMIAMMFLGMATAMVAVAAGAGAEARPASR